ncbi:hypothetical protein CRG98_014595 [Punica granatum]|uniref:DUF7745 domain-containing protein n=1 Tax=Punica granatum TaxID=22663 RepID=A0A2I0KA14_PUNGR|nr:hypothetical protein CRG98_014595 [Punica granatum]
MISGDSFSRVFVTHPREGGHSQAARSKSAHLIIGDLSLLAESLIDWTLLTTAISFWDTQRAIFNFQGTEPAPTVEEYTSLIQRPMPTRDIVVPNQFATIQSRLAILLGLRDEEVRHELENGWEHSVRIARLVNFIHIRALRATRESYQRDAYHGFLLLIFGTILFPHASILIDGALTQVILQVVGGNSYVEAVLAETMRSLYYVLEVRRGRMRGSLYLLQIWLLAHIRPFCSSHHFSYITDESSLIVHMLHVFQPSERNYTNWKQLMEELTPAQFLCAARWNPSGPMAIGCPSVIRLPLISHLRSTLVFLGRVIRQLGRLHDIPTEADRIPYRFMSTDTIASLPDSRSRGRKLRPRSHAHGVAVHQGGARSTPPRACRDTCRAHGSERIVGRVSSGSRTRDEPRQGDSAFERYAGSSAGESTRGISTAYSGVPFGHPPPLTAQTTSNFIDSSRFTVLEGMVNQLATNMTELMAMLRDQNWASSSFTPPPEHKLTVDPIIVVPLTFVSESEDISFSVTTYVPAVNPISNPLSPPPTPTTVPLPPAAFLSTDLAMHALSPLVIPVQPPIYTVPPPTVPPLMSAQKFLDQYRFCAETTPALLDLSMMEMKESQTFEAYETDWRGKATKHIPPIIERQEVQLLHSTLRGAYYSHLLAHTFSFSDLIEAGKKLDMGVKLGRIEGPSSKKDGEASKKQTTGTPLKHIHIPCIIRRPTKCRKLIPQPRQLLFSHNLRNSMLPLKFGKVEPRLRDLLSQFNGLQLHKLNRMVLLNPVNASNTHLYQLFPFTYSGSSLQETRSEHRRLVPTLMLQCRIKICAVSFIRVLLVTPWIIAGDSGQDPGDDQRKTYLFQQGAVSGPSSSLNYGGKVSNMEQEMSAMGITRSGRIYQGLEPADKGKAPAAAFPLVPETAPLPTKKVTKQEAEAFMKMIKASEYKVIEQMGKSPAHISLLALLLSSEPHCDTLLKVLTAAQVPKDTTPNWIEETVNSIFSNQISFAEDELPFEGQGHLRALHIMNMDMSHIRASKTTIRAFDGSKREVNGEIDLLIDVGPFSFSVTFQILEIPNAFSLLLGKPWIHTAVYKEMTVPYISIGEDQNLPSHSFDTISVIRDYGEVGPSWDDRMIGKVLLKNDYIPGTKLGPVRRESSDQLKWRSIAIGGDLVFAPPVMRSCKLVGENISTGSLHVTGSSPWAFRFHCSRSFSPHHRRSWEAPLTAHPLN